MNRQRYKQQGNKRRFFTHPLFLGSGQAQKKQRDTKTHVQHGNISKTVLAAPSVTTEQSGSYSSEWPQGWYNIGE